MYIYICDTHTYIHICIRMLTIVGKVNIIRLIYLQNIIYIERERVWVDIQRQSYLGESWFIVWLIQAAVATPPVTGLLFFFKSH